MIHMIKNYRYYAGGLIVLSLIIFGMIIGRRSTLASGVQLLNHPEGNINSVSSDSLIVQSPELLKGMVELGRIYRKALKIIDI